MVVKFKKLREGFELPIKAFHTDAGFDVKVHEIEQVSDTLFICYLGFATDIPEGWKGVIVPRSGQTKTNWAMLNSPGQVDSHYRGEWQVRFTYIGHRRRDTLEYNEIWFPYKVGDRIAQIFFEEVIPVHLCEVEELTETIRGNGGFGHTGK